MERDRHFTDDGRGAKTTVDLVLQARAKMSENMVNGNEDAVVSETTKPPLPEKNHTTTRCLQERFVGQMEAPSSWKVVKVVLSGKPDAEPKKGMRSYWAIALTSVMSKWSVSLVIFRQEEEKEPESWKKSHVGGIEGISCQHFQVMMTNFRQKHWEWQEDKTSD